MLYILKGRNIYEKQRFIESVQAEKGVVKVLLQSADELPGLVQRDLFSKPRVYVLNIKPKDEIDCDQLHDSENVFICLCDIDPKSSLPKKYVQSFEVPRAKEVEMWIKKYLESDNLKISNDALKLFTQRIIGNTSAFPEPKVDLESIISELTKLKIFVSPSQKITKEAVESITSRLAPVDTFALVDLIASKNVKAVNGFLKSFSEQSKQDLSRYILLVASLSEALRSWVMVKDLSDQDAEGVSGYKSGRLYILRKQSAGFGRQALVDAIGKLALMDVMLKTGELGVPLALTLTLTTLISPQPIK